MTGGPAVPASRRLRRRASRVGVVLGCAALLAGCALRFDTRSLGVPVTMASPVGQSVPGDTFNVTTQAVYLFWGLAPAKEPSLQNALAGQLGTGTAVYGLQIRARKRWTDVLVSVLTLGFVSTTSVTYSGVVARAGP